MKNFLGNSGIRWLERKQKRWRFSDLKVLLNLNTVDRFWYKTSNNYLWREISFTSQQNRNLRLFILRNLWRKYFGEKVQKYWYICRICGYKLTFWEKNFDRAVKTEFYVLRSSIWDKHFFGGKVFLYFGFWAKNNSRNRILNKSSQFNNSRVQRGFGLWCLEKRKHAHFELPNQGEAYLRNRRMICIP